MDIGFIEEQELLRASARGFLENECPSAFVRQSGRQRQPPRGVPEAKAQRNFTAPESAS